MDDHERQQLRVELNALFDEGERLQEKTAAPIADRADHRRRLSEFFERLLRRVYEDSDIQAGPPKTHQAG